MRNWKIGVLYWCMTCCFGSLIVSVLFVYQVNKIPGFHVSPTDTIVISIVLFGLSLLFSLPIIFVFRHFLRKRNVDKKTSLQLNSFLLLFFLLISLLIWINTKNALDTCYVVSPYAVLGFIFLNALIPKIILTIFDFHFLKLRLWSLQNSLNLKFNILLMSLKKNIQIIQNYCKLKFYNPLELIWKIILVKDIHRI